MADSPGAEAVFAATVALLLGLVSFKLLACTRIPYSVLLLALVNVRLSTLPSMQIWGLAIGIGQTRFVDAWHHLGTGIAVWQDIDPEFLFLLLAPPVLYQAAGSLPRASLIHNAWHIVMLGVIGVGTGTVMTSIVMRYILPYGWTWSQSLLFGAIVAATDPVAAVSLLKQVHASEELTTVVDGEALIDDGVAAVLYTIFLIAAEGRPADASGYVKLAFRLSAGGPAIGIAFALCLAVWLRWAGGNLLADLGMTLVAAYGSFHVADILGCSDILATVALGMFMAVYGWSQLESKLQKPIAACWEVIEFFANTLIFVISGIIVAGKGYDGHQFGSPHVLLAKDYGWAVVLWLLLLAIRVINIAMFWPILAKTGAGIALHSAAATAWSGIRGFVGLMLALTVYVNPDIQDASFKQMCFFFMATTACLTIIVQGGVFELVLWGLGLIQQPAASSDTALSVVATHVGNAEPPATRPAPSLVELGTVSKLETETTSP